MIDLAKQTVQRMSEYANAQRRGAKPVNTTPTATSVNDVPVGTTNIVALVNRHLVNRHQVNRQNAARMKEHRSEHGNQLALRIPVMNGNTVVGQHSITWKELGQRIADCQRGLNTAGLRADDQVVVILQPSIDMYCLTLALLGAGMVPIFIDVSMGLRKIRQALKSVTPKLVVTHQSLYTIARWLPELRRQRFILAERDASHPDSLARLFQQSEAFTKSTTSHLHSRHLPKLAARPAGSLGLVTFTSGSTGAPKGSDRSHAHLIAQHLALQNHVPTLQHDVEMPCMPVLVLHNLCNGVPSILPEVALNAQQHADGAQLIQQINRDGITRIACAPALLSRLCEAALRDDLSAPSLRSIVVGGATVSEKLCEQVTRAFAHVETIIIYGSTEAEPIASIHVSDWLQQEAQKCAQMTPPTKRQHDGYCVGAPAASTEVCVVATDAALTTEEQVAAALCGANQVGEILVRGQHVLKGYLNNPSANAALKIPCASGLVWHRTGDCGYLDSHGQLVLTGRLGDRLHWRQQHIDVYPYERQIDRLDAVQRSAFIQAGQRYYLIIESRAAKTDLHKQVHALLAKSDLPPLTLITLTAPNAMPVDGRHHSKIDRPLLRRRLRGWRGLLLRLISKRVRTGTPS
jgi:olefin beta-lactone synthetase